MMINHEALAALRHQPYTVRKRPKDNWFMSGKWYEIVRDDTVVYESFCSNGTAAIEGICRLMNAAYTNGVADTLNKVADQLAQT